MEKRIESKLLSAAEAYERWASACREGVKRVQGAGLPKLEDIHIDASTVSKRMLNLYVHPANLSQLREALRSLPCKFTKRFDTSYGRREFVGAIRLDEYTIHVYVYAHPNDDCPIKKVVETREVVRYVLDGKCKPVLPEESGDE